MTNDQGGRCLVYMSLYVVVVFVYSTTFPNSTAIFHAANVKSSQLFEKDSGKFVIKLENTQIYAGKI